ncbi:MAG: glycoside hydrolase family 16 protein [Imperialibacter sp.]
MVRRLTFLFVLSALVSCKEEDPDPAVENWCLVFEDEFDSLDQTVWEPSVAPNGITYRTDRQENVRVENGLLIMELHKEDYEGYAYTGADIASVDYYQYGKIECRAKLPTANRAWPAFWMLGSYDEYGEWPNCGEIDILEYWGYNAPDVYTNIHTRNSNWKNGRNREKHSTSVSLLDATEQFHIYGLEWYRDRLEFYIDGSHYWTFDKFSDNWRKWPFDHPMRIVFQMFAAPDYEGSDAELPDQFEVDYVRVYKACQ